LPARLGEPQRGSALAGKALVGALRLENHFLRSAQIEPKLFSVVRFYMLMNINVETGWKTLGKHGRVSQEHSVIVYTPLCCTPLLTPPGFIIINIINEDT